MSFLELEKPNGEFMENKFELTLREYEKAYTQREKDSYAFSNVLERLATMLAYSVINKCIDPQKKTATKNETVSNSGVSPVMMAVKIDLARAVSMTQNARNASENAYEVSYNADGEYKRITKDADAVAMLDVYANTDIGTGIDLAQAACVALLEESEKAEKDGRTKLENWMEKEYTIRETNKRVYINDSPRWENKNTCAIVQVFKAVRREVENTQSARNASERFIYLSEYVLDPEGDQYQQIYHRLKKNYDSGNVESVSGRYTADWNTYGEIVTAVEKLNLTARQRQVLSYRLQGFGYKAIATKLDVQPMAIHKTMRLVQKKAENIFHVLEK